MSIQCGARRVDATRMENFEDGPKFHLPFRCPQTAIKDELCGSCLQRKYKPTTKCLESNYLGLWAEGFDDDEKFPSRMAFSPYFFKKVKEGFGISEKSMGRAKKSVEGSGLEEIAETLPTAIEGKKKRAPPKKKSAVVPAPVPVAPAPVEAPIEKKKPRIVKPRKVDTKAVIIEPALEEEIIYIPVIAFEIEGARYYLDSVKNKLYDRAADGGTKAEYKGRWDSYAEKIITDIPDSDSE